MKRRLTIGIAALALCGCAAQRYQWNLTHAYITPWTHLSPQDHDAIVRLISYRDQMPIIGISAHPADDRGATISVYTGNVDQITYSFWHGYDLSKVGGRWHIVFDGDSSHTIAELDLSGEMRAIQQQRKR
jgi:hypothetical protein